MKTILAILLIFPLVQSICQPREDDVDKTKIISNAVCFFGGNLIHSRLGYTTGFQTGVTILGLKHYGVTICYAFSNRKDPNPPENYFAESNIILPNLKPGSKLLSGVIRIVRFFSSDDENTFGLALGASYSASTTPSYVQRYSASTLGYTDKYHYTRDFGLNSAIHLNHNQNGRVGIGVGLTGNLSKYNTYLGLELNLLFGKMAKR